MTRASMEAGTKHLASMTQATHELAQQLARVMAIPGALDALDAQAAIEDLDSVEQSIPGMGGGNLRAPTIAPVPMPNFNPRPVPPPNFNPPQPLTPPNFGPGPNPGNRSRFGPRIGGARSGQGFPPS